MWGKVFMSFLLILMFVSSANAEVDDLLKGTGRFLSYKVVKEERWIKEGNITRKAIVDQYYMNKTTCFAFEESEDKIFLMTCGHCVEDTGHCVEFNYEGYVSSRAPVEILFKICNINSIWRIADDFAILSMEKKSLVDYPLPKIIPLLGDNEPQQKVGDVVVTAGCPAVEEYTCVPTAFFSTIIQVDNYLQKIWHGVHGGRSGSPVTNKECTRIIGIINFQDGGGMNVRRIKELMKLNKVELK